MATNNSAKELDGRRPIGVAVGYGLMVRCMIAAFLLIRSFGEALMAPPAVQAPAGSATAAGTDVFLRVLVTLAAIIITGQDYGAGVSKAVRRHVCRCPADGIGQPQFREIGHADEYPRPHRVDHPQRRAGFGNHLTHSFCHDGVDGACRRDTDFTYAAPAKSAGNLLGGGGH